MHRFLLFAGTGLSILASGSCCAGPALPLAVAAARNAADVVRSLLLEKHDVDGRDAGGLTPLMWAARCGALDAMRALLDGGANPESRDLRNGWTALFHAIHKQQVEAVRLLLERGVDPNQPVRLTTPLMMAAAEADPAIVTLLLARGADPSTRGSGGSTALTIAVSGGAFSDVDRPLLGGCHPATVRALKEHDPSLNLPDTIAGWNALWWARFHGCQEVIDLVAPAGMHSTPRSKTRSKT